MQKIIFLLIILILLLALAVLFLYFKDPAHQSANIVNLKIGDEALIIEMANTPAKRMKGLSGREDLGEIDGMLFTSRRPITQVFWMKGMQFPLDMLWIRENKIIGLTQNIPIDSGPNYKLYRSNEPADMVLELAAGSAKKHNFKVGDTIKVSNN